MENYDVIVIGGGPGGYLAAELAGKAGLKTAVIEKRAFGGVCLNEGCIPSKAFLNSAKLYEHAKDSASFGITTEKVVYDHKTVVERKNRVVKTLTAGVRAILKANKAEMIDGVGVIAGKTSEGLRVTVGNTSYSGKNLIIATGSEAIVPPIKGAAEGMKTGLVVTNREILDSQALPKELAVIGGGVIGIEMASYFNSVGSKVTVVEMLDQIGGNLDSGIAAMLQKEYEKKGVTFKLGCKVTEIGKDSVTFEKDGKAQKASADMVLLSVGRKPTVEGIGLETIGVYTEKGRIVTDENLRTNISGVYAVGDVNGKSMLAHTAYREAEVAINCLTSKPDTMNYGTIPSVIYTTPEVASVGETEESAASKGYKVKTVAVEMNHSGRYLAESDNPAGTCKLIMDMANKNLLGVHIMGSYASEIIFGAAIMVESQLPVKRLKEFVIPHPTVGELLHNALFELE